LIADLDIEYVNFDFPAEPYLDPERCFEIQRPVEWAVERALLEHGITAFTSSAAGGIILSGA
jgi:hypothetical protein